MKDIKRVIEALKHLISKDCTDTQFDYADEIETAIDLLREQPQIVRCKDCKYRREIPVMGNIVCVDNSVHSPGWFCADGERADT